MVTENDQQMPTTEESSEESAVVNPWSRLVAVITDPAAAMRGVAQKGSWWVPLLVFIVAVGIFSLIAGDVVSEFAMDQTRERFDEMVQTGQLTQEQADQFMQRQSGGMMQVFMIVNPVIATFLVKLLFAGLFLLGGNVIFGGNAKFGQYWAVLWYASVIGAIGMIVGGILMNATGDMYGAQLGLGIITKGDPTSTAHKILSVFNVFSIWEGIVAGIGLAMVAKVSQGKGIAWGLVCYLGLGLLTSLLTGQAWV
ncbi:YIP1 family protein [bacterium]|nr:YIP1 family protein [bacterium]